MLIELYKLAGSRVGQWILVGSIGLGIGVFAHKRLTPPTTAIQVVHDTKQVEVQVPVLTEKAVDRIITDPKQQALINQLLKENHDLKLKVETVTVTNTTTHSEGGTTSGSGGTAKISSPSLPTSETVKAFVFKDFQLTAQYLSDGSKFDYALNQKFNVVTTTGKDKDGNSVSLVNVFQTTPTGDVLLPSTTTAIHTAGRQASWFISPRIQAGLSVDQSKGKGGVVAFQWLKRGKSKANEDIPLAIGSIGAIVDGKATPALFPASINLGTIPKQPFTNLWISPWVDINKRVGVSLTATF